MLKFLLIGGDENMSKDIKDEHLKILENINNPNITKVINLSKELDIDIKILAQYFIDKESNLIDKD